jgi:hypothetical protein
MQSWALNPEGIALRDDDIRALAQKVVSKAEGAMSISLASRHRRARGNRSRKCVSVLDVRPGVGGNGIAAGHFAIVKLYDTGSFSTLGSEPSRITTISKQGATYEPVQASINVR